MNRTELIEEIAKRTDSSTDEAQRYVDTFEEVIAPALRRRPLSCFSYELRVAALSALVQFEGCFARAQEANAIAAKAGL